MREYIGIDTIANTVCMLRVAVEGALWLVDREDEACFYERCAHTKSRVIPSPHVAIAALDCIEKRGIQGVVAAISGRRRVNHGRRNVFQTHFGDVASLLLVSPCFERGLEHIAGVPWVLAFEKLCGPVGPHLISVAWALEQVKDKYGEGIDSAAATTDTLVDWNVLEPCTATVARVYGAEAGGMVGSLVLAGKAIGSERMLADLDGMVVLDELALALALYCPLGVKARSAMAAAGIMAVLVARYDSEQLTADPVFWQMRRWERMNLRFVLLSEWRSHDALGVVWDQRYWENDLRMVLGSGIVEDGVVTYLMDLDNFKEVNGELGHGAGDEAIRMYCRLVRDILGPVGEVYRRGGDEVIVIAPDLSVAAARELPERLRTTIEVEFRQWGETRGLARCPTVSIGGAIASGSADYDLIVRTMESAHKLAKRDGKNRVVLQACTPA